MAANFLPAAAFEGRFATTEGGFSASESSLSECQLPSSEIISGASSSMTSWMKTKSAGETTMIEVADQDNDYPTHIIFAIVINDVLQTRSQKVVLGLPIITGNKNGMGQKHEHQQDGQSHYTNAIERE